MKKLILMTLAVIAGLSARAQQYDGLPGLIHTPVAGTDTVGTARIGTHYIRKEMMPDDFVYGGSDGLVHKYNSASYYLSIAPFNWVQASYTCVMIRRREDRNSYKGQDRHVSVRFSPLKEGRWYPAVSFGAQDLLGTTLDSETSQNRFWNVYAAASKHFDLGGHKIGVNAVYRYYLRDINKKFQGVVGGLTYSPSFAPNCRLIAEWDGCHFNAAVDALLWRSLLLQLSLEDCQYITGGIAWKIPLIR